MGKQRYVIRLHRVIRQELDLRARKQGHLTSTYIALAIEDISKEIDIQNYELHPDSEVFQLKRGKKSKGEVKNNADKQLSIYLSDFAFHKVGELVEKLQKEVDKSITSTFVIRDMLFHWLDKNNEAIAIQSSEEQ